MNRWISDQEKNQSNNRSVSAVKINRINFQVTTNVCHIIEPETVTIAVSKLDKNSDTCCLGENLTVLKMKSRNANVYQCDTSYKPLYNLPIFSGATTVTDYITGN